MADVPLGLSSKTVHSVSGIYNPFLCELGKNVLNLPGVLLENGELIKEVFPKPSEQTDEQ